MGCCLQGNASISSTFKILTHVNISSQNNFNTWFPEIKKINNYNRTFAFVIFYSLLFSFEDKSVSKLQQKQ